MLYLIFFEDQAYKKKRSQLQIYGDLAQLQIYGDLAQISVPSYWNYFGCILLSSGKFSENIKF